MFLRAFSVGRWKSMLCWKYKQINQPEALNLSPKDHIAVSAMHLVVMDDVLAFDDQLAACFQNTVRLADRVPVVIFQFVIAPIA